MEAIQVSPVQLIAASRSIQGHASGASIDSEDTLNFSALAKIPPMIETMPLEQAAAAYDRMMSGDCALPLDGAVPPDSKRERHCCEY